MKSLVLSMLLLALALPAFAQISLQPGDITMSPNGDTIHYTRLAINEVLLPEGGEDKVWDYSNITFNGSQIGVFSANDTEFFPSSNLYAPIESVYAGVPVLINRYFTLTDDGFSIDGFVDLSLELPLQAATGNPADTLIIVGGERAESVARAIYQLPMAYEDEWGMDSRSNINFVVNAPTFGLAGFAVRQQIDRTVSTTVNGWGTILLRDPDTEEVLEFETLLVTEQNTRRDSFLDAANNPLPAALLAPLGLTQGSESNATHYYFYMPGLDYFGVYFFSADGELETALQNKDLFQNGTPVVSTRWQQVPQVAHKVFPNPVAGHQFELQLDKNSTEEWGLSVFDTAGRLAHQQIVVGPLERISLPAQLTAGSYFYQLTNAAGQTVGSGKIALRQ
ncbi:T9SS type A sorting domain-containing protein [Phaeodactylibacter luteus]|uniref:T9SS type A sorting domain-containing protein n=1 Tax=Phaeodactylibacter luteus TaxID=1564516 RepID=A0A5C6S6Y1_9BACT|nr:T9SS type A sorting domain-containing protein [Phaeodactylibacter luteus]TXB70175.1 T9SS type A sorting domain-containing protein [Phaeodactylibacter luteus]